MGAHRHDRIHFIIVMIRWTGLAPSEFEFPFPGSLISTFLRQEAKWAHIDMAGPVWNAKESSATGYGVKGLTHWITAPPAPKA